MTDSIGGCIRSVRSIAAQAGCWGFLTAFLAEDFLSDEQSLTVVSLIRGYIVLGLCHALLCLVNAWQVCTLPHRLLLGLLGVDPKRQAGREEDLQVALAIERSRVESLRRQRKAAQLAARQAATAHQAATARVAQLEGHLTEAAELAESAQRAAAARIDDLEEELADAAQEAVTAHRASTARSDELEAAIELLRRETGRLMTERWISESESRAALGEVQLSLDREQSARQDAERQLSEYRENLRDVQLSAERERAARLDAERQLADERIQAGLFIRQLTRYMTH